MTRTWVKLHVAILDHPGIGKLEPEHCWRYVQMIALAGRIDADGKLGTRDDVAWALRVSRPDLDAAIAGLNGRILEADGMLSVRDWSDYQPQRSDAERAREWREAQAANERTKRDRTNGERSANVPEVEVEVEIEEKVEVEKKQKRGGQAATVAAVAAFSPKFSNTIKTRFGQLFGVGSLKTSRGYPPAYLGRFLATLGDLADDNAANGLRLVEAWVAHEKRGGDWGKPWCRAEHAHERLATWYSTWHDKGGGT